MEWFAKEIWPNIEGTDEIAFTWTAANNLIKEFCPLWVKQNPSFDKVIFLVGVLEDPFAASSIGSRIPTLVRRFVCNLKKKYRSNSFATLDSTMTVIGALKLLGLSISPGSEHKLDKIRNAYKTKALKIHPDSGGSNEEMRKLNEAYILLKNLYKK